MISGTKGLWPEGCSVHRLESASTCCVVAVVPLLVGLGWGVWALVTVDGEVPDHSFRCGSSSSEESQRYFACGFADLLEIVNFP